MTHREQLEDRIKARLAEATYPDLDQMMAGYAAAAVQLAEQLFHQTLDYLPQSLDAFEAVLSELAEHNDLDYEHEVRLWGGYLGELIRLRYSGAWEMVAYPGGSAMMPAVDVRGSHIFPLMKVYRRLTAGEHESISAFYHLLSERLGKPARVN
uniref:DUF3806 domain-containing protein n=1 Tax=mine drainage metagenome TaxID=410659 RepID=E6QL07_9ZZZZ